MAKGRKKLPTVLKIVRGTARKCRILQAEVNYDEICVPAAPDELDPEAKAEWDKYFPLFKGKGLATKADLPLLLDLCFIIARLKFIRSKITNENIVYSENTGKEIKVKTDKGWEKRPLQIPKINPYIKAYVLFIDRLYSLSAKFGMSPADRTRINMPEKFTKPDLEKEFIRKSG